MGVFLSARWSSLAMLSWPVDPSRLAPLVPMGTELDDHDGVTYVSLVGFRFEETSVFGVPVPWHRNFDEVNLRFYLRRYENGAWQRGVTFIRELVPRRAIAWLARMRYNEPYLAVPMVNSIDADEVAFRWRPPRAAWTGMWLRMRDAWRQPSTNELDGWIAEHYWGWTRQRDGGTVAYRVEHPSWRIRSAAAPHRWRYRRHLWPGVGGNPCRSSGIGLRRRWLASDGWTSGPLGVRLVRAVVRPKR